MRGCAARTSVRRFLRGATYDVRPLGRRPGQRYGVGAISREQAAAHGAGAPHRSPPVRGGFPHRRGTAAMLRLHCLCAATRARCPPDSARLHDAVRRDRGPRRSAAGNAATVPGGFPPVARHSGRCPRASALALWPSVGRTRERTGRTAYGQRAAAQVFYWWPSAWRSRPRVVGACLALARQTAPTAHSFRRRPPMSRSTPTRRTVRFVQAPSRAPREAPARRPRSTNACRASRPPLAFYGWSSGRSWGRCFQNAGPVVRPPVCGSRNQRLPPQTP